MTDGTDAFRVFHAGTPSPWVYAGTLNSTTSLTWSLTLWTPFNVFGLYTTVETKWETNNGGQNYNPPSFGQVIVKCRPTQTTTATNGVALSPNTGVDGLLLSSGDTIYFNVQQAGFRNMVVTVERLAGAANLDLFADSTNVTPDGTSQWQSTTSAGAEAVEIPAVVFSRNIYIGVRAASGGAGHFRIHASQQDLPARMTLSMCPLNFTPTTTERNAIRTLFRRASARLFSATNGNQFVKQLNLTSQVSTCGSTCDVCLDNINSPMTGSPLGSLPCGQIRIPRSVWSSATDFSVGIMHEWGHACFALIDEYLAPPFGDSSPGWCGHSTMNNLSQTRNFCSRVHCIDGNVVNPISCLSQSGPDSNWKRMKAQGKVPWGEDFAATSNTSDPTQHNTNVALTNLVSTNF